MFTYLQKRTFPVLNLSDKKFVEDKSLRKRIFNEFKDIETYCLTSKQYLSTIGNHFEFNPLKDRYRDILPNPKSTCVRLSHLHEIEDFKEKSPEFTSHSPYYINANYVKGFTFEYICTQYPLINTTADFWNMVYNESVNLIVCLTDLDGELHEYWPGPKRNLHRNLNLKFKRYIKSSFDENEKMFKISFPSDEIEVFTKKVSTYPNIVESSFLGILNKGSKEREINEKSEKLVVRTLRVVNKITKRERSIVQIHFRDWKDKTEPTPSQTKGGSGLSQEYDDFRKLYECFYRYLYFVNKSHKIRVLIHCRAGVGRTGTFLAIDSLLHKMIIQMNNFTRLGSLDIANEVITLRMQRKGLVQNKEQYYFIHKFLNYVLRNGLSEKLGIKFVRFQIPLNDIAELNSSDLSDYLDSDEEGESERKGY